MGLPISQVVPSGFVFTSEGPHYSLAFFFCQAIPGAHQMEPPSLLIS